MAGGLIALWRMISVIHYFTMTTPKKQVSGKKIKELKQRVDDVEGTAGAMIKRNIELEGLMRAHLKAMNEMEENRKTMLAAIGELQFRTEDDKVKRERMEVLLIELKEDRSKIEADQSRAKTTYKVLAAHDRILGYYVNDMEEGLLKETYKDLLK